MTHKLSILLVEDEKNICDFISTSRPHSGDTFENVKIIPKPGYIIKSATWNDGELTILQDEDTVGKVSLPALEEDAALTVSFEQAEVEQEAESPCDDIEIVFSNAQDENTREVSEDGITYSISKGQTVTIKSKSGKSISFNNEKKSVLGSFLGKRL